MYNGTKRALVRRSDDKVVSHVSMDNIFLYVMTVGTKYSPSAPSDVLMAIITHETSDESVKEMQSGSLYHFHQRLGHFGYDEVEWMAKDPAPGTKNKDRSRPTCVSCAEGNKPRMCSNSRTRVLTC